MDLVFWFLALGVFIWALTSRKPIVRYLARGVAVVIALAAAAAMIGLIAIGQKAHWTSDGPGMLLIMLGIPICGIVAWFFGMMAITTTANSEGTNPDTPARNLSLAQAWEFYKDVTKKRH